MRYAELHCYSNFTFLHGASHPEELVERAQELELSAIALTDRDGLYGSVRFAGAARLAQVDAIIGSELTFEDGSCAIALVETAEGYANCCELISIAQMRGSKGDARLQVGDFEGRSDGLFVLVRTTDVDRIKALRGYLRERLYLELQQHLTTADTAINEQLLGLARELKLPVVATNAVAYAKKEEAPMADVLTCIKETTSLEEARAANKLRPNAEYHLKSAAAMRKLFSAHPEAIEATLSIAGRCTFRLERLVGQFPHFPTSPGTTRQSTLRELVYRGAADRYTLPLDAKVERQLEYELGIIAKMDLAGYFLIVWDIVQAAHRFGVLCQGRGSAANSAVCYSLGITAVDPIGMNLLFERFMSEERQEIPDIDIDFAHQDREKVIQYIYDKYGRNYAAMAAEVITYHTKSAIRDIGKALGLTLAQVDQVARDYDTRETLKPDTDPCHPEHVEGPIGGVLLERLQKFSERIEGFPRHMGIHSGGMVLTRDPLVRVAPVEWATMRDRTIIQWDKDDLQELGLIKIDLLGLGMLSLLREAFSLHKRTLEYKRAIEPEGEGVFPLFSEAPNESRSQDGESDEEGSSVFLHDAKTASGSGNNGNTLRPSRLASRAPQDDRLALHTIPADDKPTYEMICKADTIGVFQIESRAQQSMLPRMKPACFYDIVMQVAIIRPGPIQGQMVHPFLRRRAGLEPVTYPHPKLKPVLERTMGVPLFQEQGMRMAIEAAGFSAGEADQLRRAMGHKRSRQRMAEIHPRLVEGMIANGIKGEAAEQLYHMLQGFADYGFPESHAASFALLAYASAYVKCHYPAVFAAAILNVQPMGFYSTEVLVNDAKRHKVVVKPIEVNASEYWSFVDEEGALRLGFHLVRGLGEAQKERLEAAIAGGTFADLLEFATRTKLEKEAIENLAVAGAFMPWYRSRRDAMWALRALDEREARGELGRLMDMDEPVVVLKPVEKKLETAFDLWSTGVTTGKHAIEHFRAQLDAARVVIASKLAEMPNNLVCRVGGLVITRQRPGTAKGFVFLTLEDETGLVNVIVRPDVYEKYRRVIRSCNTLVIEGKLQKEQGAIDVLARAIYPFNADGVLDDVKVHSFY